MTQVSIIAQLIAIVLDAFRSRGLVLVDVEAESDGRHRIRFDLDGHRLHALVDERSLDTFVLELQDALVLDEVSHPGIIAATIHLINDLHGRIHFVRFMVGDLAAPYRKGPTPVLPIAGLEPPGDSEVVAAEALVSARFDAPLFGDAQAYWCNAFELGLDVLLYAVGRLYDELREAGFPVLATGRIA
jgi:hypothetical protein